ncbi:MAG: sensor histidine kinase [Peptostreptococcaceae bacterium]
MIINNPEVKNFFVKFFILVSICVLLIFGISNMTLNSIKNKVIENNQIIIGTIVNKYPELEEEIVGIVTQGRNTQNLNLGKEILEKYNYSAKVGISTEPILSKSMNDIYKYNSILVISIIVMFLAIIIEHFIKLYKDIRDMTNYVYYSSEHKNYNMKNKNQEGEIGLLKTELMKMTNILKENVELLKNEKIFLNNAISDISHQLKTPMTSLILLNDLMYNDIEKEVRIDFLNRTKTQLNRMDWLIKSMLKLSKIEAKVIEFKKEEVNIKELVHRAIEPTKVLIEEKNIDIIVSGENESNFVGDNNWCTEALVNIIKNCVEHTPKYGSLKISYKESTMYTEIIIEDSGEGIDEQDIKHIFKRFYRGKNSVKEDSVGIGLAMAKSIIESQNGDISVKSQKNKGTEFIIIFHKNYCD